MFLLEETVFMIREGSKEETPQVWIDGTPRKQDRCGHSCGLVIDIANAMAREGSSEKSCSFLISVSFSYFLPISFSLLFVFLARSY